MPKTHLASSSLIPISRTCIWMNLLWFARETPRAWGCVTIAHWSHRPGRCMLGSSSRTKMLRNFRTSQEYTGVSKARRRVSSGASKAARRALVSTGHSSSANFSAASIVARE